MINTATILVMFIYFWAFCGRVAAAAFMAIIFVGVLTYAYRADQTRMCDGRAWFCEFMK